MGVSMFLRYYNLGGINMHIRLSYFDVRQRLAQVPNLAPARNRSWAAARSMMIGAMANAKGKRFWGMVFLDMSFDALVVWIVWMFMCVFLKGIRTCEYSKAPTQPTKQEHWVRQTSRPWRGSSIILPAITPGNENHSSIFFGDSIP